MKAHNRPSPMNHGETSGIPIFSRSLQPILAVLVAPFALLMMAVATMAFIEDLRPLLNSNAPSQQGLLALAATLSLAVVLSWLAWSLWLGRGVPLAIRRGFLVSLYGGVVVGLAWSYFTNSDTTGWAMLFFVMAMSWNVFPVLWGARPVHVPRTDPAC